MEQSCLNKMKSSWQMQIFSKIILKTFLKLAPIHGENYSRRMETPVRMTWKQRMLCLVLPLDFLKSHLEFQKLIQSKIFPWVGKNNKQRYTWKNIKQESYHQFSDPVKDTILNFPEASVVNINWIYEQVNEHNKEKGTEATVLDFKNLNDKWVSKWVSFLEKKGKSGFS